MDFTADLSAMFADFGVAATVGGASVRGIFDNGYAEAFGMEGSAPSLTCLSADVAGAARGAVVVVNAVNYTVITKKPDGTGLTRLVLEEA